VLEYLVHEGYARTARAFGRGTVVRELDADGDEVPPPAEEETDAEFLARRNGERARRSRGCMRAHGADIRALILAGRADDALWALEAHFPAVLAPVPAPDADAPRAPEDANAPRPFVAATSLEPAHVALNLRIMAFVEDVRAEPLGSPPSPVDPLADETPATPPPALDPERAARLIARARKLQKFARALPRAADRAVYGAELARVCALLAYVPASRAPAAQRAYLGSARRAAVAAQVNAAILRACCRVWNARGR
jgi:hypothetical protein